MTITFWHWLALGGVLLLLELLTPGVVFLWLALAAGLTGVVLALLPGLGWHGQLLSFAALAVVSVAVSFRWRRRLPAAGGDPALNRRGLACVGTEAILETAIGPGHGRVRIADATWPAAGPELPAGTRVRVVGAQGAVLLVTPTSARPVSPA
jgi:inner membrane protein